ncbi:MAG: hypothetical protein MZW92_75155 [Comamonadaceae bacterium]|nr:hypothetical protein [Comamonadaceae bacterium]
MLALRRSVYQRILAEPFGKLLLDEIEATALGALLDRVKTERGPGPAVHVRELVVLVCVFAAAKGHETPNPGERLSRKAYATFVRAQMVTCWMRGESAREGLPAGSPPSTQRQCATSTSMSGDLRSLQRRVAKFCGTPFVAGRPVRSPWDRASCQ